MKGDIWKDLLEAVAAGQPVQIELSPGQRIVRPKRRRGRPRVRGAAPWAHYAGYRPEKGVRPKCAKRGCSKRLRREQRLACCPEHEEYAVGEAKSMLEKAATPAAEKFG